MKQKWRQVSFFGFSSYNSLLILIISVLNSSPLHISAVLHAQTKKPMLELAFAPACRLIIINIIAKID